jgi:hypothetical protein
MKLMSIGRRLAGLGPQALGQTNSLLFGFGSLFILVFLYFVFDVSRFKASDV